MSKLLVDHHARRVLLARVEAAAPSTHSQKLRAAVYRMAGRAGYYTGTWTVFREHGGTHGEWGPLLRPESKRLEHALREQQLSKPELRALRRLLDMKALFDDVNVYAAVLRIGVALGKRVHFLPRVDEVALLAALCAAGGHTESFGPDGELRMDPSPVRGGRL